MHFPLELVEKALDNIPLAGYTATLKQSALVCRAWLHPARRRLFCYKRFTSSFDCGGFFQILRSSPGIADCIRTVDIVINSEDWTPWVEQFANIAAMLKRVTFFSVLRFPGQFDGVGHHCFTVPLRPMFESCTIVDIIGVQFIDAYELRRFITSFPQLSVLGVLGVDIGAGDEYDERDPSVLPTCSNLLDLTITDCEGEVYVALVDLATNLRKFDAEDWADFYAFLPPGRTLPSIEELIIPSLGFYDARPNPLTKAMPNLRKFMVRNEFPEFSSEEIACLVSDLAPTVIHILLQLRGTDKAGVQNFSSLVSAIDYAHLPALEVVELDLLRCGAKSIEEMDEVRLLMAEKFRASNFAERGLLRLKCSE